METTEMEEMDEVPELTKQFFVTLRARFARIDPEQLQGDHLRAEYDAIRDLLGQGETWRTAYEVEQRMCQILDEQTLETEAGRRLVESATGLPASMTDYYSERLEEASIEGKRSVLARIVDDLQWRYQKEECEAVLRRESTRSASLALCLSVAAFGIVFFATSFSGGALMLLAAVSGILGATFSLVLGLPARLAGSTFNELKLESGGRTRSVTLVRLALGAAAATIMFCLVQSRALGGKLMPEFRTEVAVERLEKDLLGVLDAEIRAFKRKKLDDVKKRSASAGKEKEEELAKAVEKESGALRENSKKLLHSKIDRFQNLLEIGSEGQSSLRVEVATLVAELSSEISSPDLVAKLLDVLAVAEAKSIEALDATNRALLILWCILAGFSERFVPNLLGRLEAKAVADKTKPPTTKPNAPRRPATPPAPAAEGDGGVG